MSTFGINPGAVVSESRARKWSPGWRRARSWLARLAFTVVPVAFLSSVVVFGLSYFAPGNPAVTKLGQDATPAAIARLDRLWGLNHGFVHQYLTWIGHALTGNLGSSYISGMAVGPSLIQKLPVDVSIVLVALVTMIVLGFAAGIVAAVRQGGIADRVITVIASAASSIPEFWLAIMAVVLFSVVLHLLPSAGWVPFSQDPWQWLQHMLLPGVSLGIIYGAPVARQLRGSLITELDSNYVVGARVRGLSPTRILFGHALRNASAPAVATIGLSIPTMLGGAVVAETIFGLPGLGQYALDGAQSHDIPVVQGVLLVSLVIVLVCNLVVDAILTWMRPATRGARR